MSRLSREVFVERTRNLLVQQGAADLSLSSVLDACHANKGSLYHFFPEGKDELVRAAIERQASFAISMNRRLLEESPCTGTAVFNLCKSLAREMDASDYSLCLPFSAVGAISGDVSEELRLTCTKTLAELEGLYALHLRKEGVPAKESKTLGSMIASTVEGALLQSRTRQTSVPLKNAGRHLRDLIESMVSPNHPQVGEPKRS